MDLGSFLPYTKPSISAEDIATVGRVLAEDSITRGPQVEEFEKALAQYCGASFAVLFNSGTSALQAAHHAAQVGPQDRVLTTPNAFVATAGASIRRGASPIFVDVDPATGNMDLDKLDPNLERETSRGRPVIVPLHYAGMPVPMRQLEKLVRQSDTVVIEDASAALGSAYDATHKVGCCAWSQMTVFSFHAAKVISTGEGGAVTTNDPELHHRLRRFRNNGIECDGKCLVQPAEDPWSYEVHEITGNYNITDFQAALGLSQLQKMEQFMSKRQEILSWYRMRLAGIAQIEFPVGLLDPLVLPQLMALQIDFGNVSRKEVMSELHNQGIGSRVHYVPIYRHPYFRQRLGDLSAYFPGAERFYARALTLPLYQDLEEQDVARICSSLIKALRV